MKKIFIYLLLSISLIASSFEDSVKIDQLINDNTIKYIFKDFEPVTGEKLRLYEIKKDKNLKKALYQLYFDYEKSKIKIYVPKKAESVYLNIELPKYKEALNNLYKSDSVYAAWIGATLIHDRLIGFDQGNKFSDQSLQDLVNRYYPKFLTILNKNNICYGYYLTEQYFKRYNKNHKKYLKYLNKSYKTCMKQNVPEWLKQEVKLEYFQRKAYEKYKAKKKKEVK